MKNLKRKFKNTKWIGKVYEVKEWTWKGYTANELLTVVCMSFLITSMCWAHFYKQPVISKINIITPPRIEAVESKEQIVITPTPTPTSYHYGYMKFKNQPHYEEITSKLKFLYINWEAVAEIIGRESSFIPDNINSIGACGLPQALPCEKMGCSLDDIDCQLKWQKEYIGNRYGTSTKALEFWDKNHWY